jgi:hypothetical protein
MCIFSTPKMPAAPAPAQMQAMQPVKDFTDPLKQNRDTARRRGLFASIFTGPQGLVSPPTTTASKTGGSSSATGG